MIEPVLEELARLGAKTRSRKPDLDAPGPLLEFFAVEWPKGITYRTMADHKADREVWWVTFTPPRALGPKLIAFGTSDNGKVAICVARDDADPEDPVIFLADEHSVRESSRLTTFLMSLEREPTRGGVHMLKVKKPR